MVELLDVHSKKAIKFLFILEHIPVWVAKFRILVFLHVCLSVGRVA